MIRPSTGKSLATASHVVSKLRCLTDLLSDSAGDVKLYDPKIVVMNYFGDDLYDLAITRFHTLKVEDLVGSFGELPDGRDGAAENHDNICALQIETKALIKRVIFDRNLTPIPEGK